MANLNIFALVLRFWSGGQKRFRRPFFAPFCAFLRPFFLPHPVWAGFGFCVLLAGSLAAQVTLHADGPGNTYELINGVLGGTAEEVPDCSDPAFGRHIVEQYDPFLGKYVFAFYIHVTPDNDRCTAFDRQRNEIKTYGPSPAYVKGFYGDTCSFRWKFKLDAGFQPSPNFTHIHQIKAGDGSDSDSPIITITPRSASPDRVEIIYTAPTGSNGSGTKATANLSGFKGQWIEAFERVSYTTNGTYQLTLTRLLDGFVLLSFTNNNLNLWRGDATFNRPKWGIYRSLDSSNYLRDEAVLFADFCIAKGNDFCPSDVGTLHPPLYATNIVRSAGKIIVSGTGAVADLPYYVLASTNPNLPRSAWARMATNTFDASGNFTFTTSLSPNTPQRFFILQVP